jgi:RNA-directed DNA polymerase
VFNLGRLENLAQALGLPSNLIAEVLDAFDTNPSLLVDELTLWPADETKKPRDVISVKKAWRLIQRRIYLKLLLPQFNASPYSHGGVKRRSTATNARAHLGNSYAFIADIANFFPGISCSRVNRLFLRQACSYDVAGILTRLCTYDFHLALGLVTSPIIANELLKPIDARIAHACRNIGLVYSRFVDDITISSKFDLESSGIESVVREIIERHRFSLAESKTRFGRIDGDVCITGVRLKTNHLDPSKQFLAELDRLLDDHASLAVDGHFDGPLLTESEIFGKAHYACALNPGRRRSILARLKSIEWWTVMSNAGNRNLVRHRNRLAPRGAPRPDSNEPLPLSAGAKYCREYWRTATLDPSIPPFDVVPAAGENNHEVIDATPISNSGPDTI